MRGRVTAKTCVELTYIEFRYPVIVGNKRDRTGMFIGVLLTLVAYSLESDLTANTDCKEKAPTAVPSIVKVALGLAAESSTVTGNTVIEVDEEWVIVTMSPGTVGSD